MLNTKTVLVAENMGREGWAVLQARPDLRLVSYHPSISPNELHALLQDASGDCRKIGGRKSFRYFDALGGIPIQA